METSEFFKQLGLGDPDMEKAREWVSYSKFEESVPSVLTLSEFVDTVLKHTVKVDAKPHLWFSEKYMIGRYLHSETPATDEYVEQFNNKIKLLKSKLALHIECEHIQKFLDILIDQIHTTRLVFQREVLEYLNELYKKKVK